MSDDGIMSVAESLKQDKQDGGSLVGGQLSQVPEEDKASNPGADQIHNIESQQRPDESSEKGDIRTSLPITKIEVTAPSPLQSSSLLTKVSYMVKNDQKTFCCTF